MVSTSCVQIIALVGEIRPLYQQEYPGEPETMELLQQYLYARIRNRLHIVLCMSPEHPRFAERLRKFPALVGCCNIDWFLPWPREALLAVSQGFLQPFQAEVSAGWLACVATLQHCVPESRLAFSPPHTHFLRPLLRPIVDYA